MNKLLAMFFMISLPIFSSFGMEESSNDELSDIFNKKLSIQQAVKLNQAAGKKYGKKLPVSLATSFVSTCMGRFTSIFSQERVDSTHVENNFFRVYDDVFTNKYNQPHQKGDLLYLTRSFLETMDEIEKDKITTSIGSMIEATRASYSNSIINDQENTLPANLNFNPTPAITGKQVRFALNNENQ